LFLPVGRAAIRAAQTAPASSPGKNAAKLARKSWDNWENPERSAERAKVTTRAARSLRSPRTGARAPSIPARIGGPLPWSTPRVIRPWRNVKKSPNRCQ
jgi:hypothetical protein